VGGTRHGGIGRNRQTQGEFMGRSGGKVVELWGFPLFIAWGKCRRLSRYDGGALQWGNCRDFFSYGGIMQGLHYIGELW
jgi:hypothetical protein